MQMSLHPFLQSRQQSAAKRASPRCAPAEPLHIRLVYGRTPDVLLHLDMQFDLLLTDPPYNSPRKSYFALPWQKHQNRDFGPWDAVENTDYSWLEPVVTRLLKKDSALLIFSPFERIGDYEDVLTALGCTYKTTIVWHKTNGVVHVPTYKSACEAIIYAVKGRPFFRKWETQKGFAAHNYIRGPSCMGAERARWGHPTQKPEYLIARLLHRHSQPGYWVLDPFMGVGTVPAVCWKMGRHCLGVEQDATYYQRAAQRLQELGWAPPRPCADQGDPSRPALTTAHP
ncbi:MAG: site-specific DNA-methyltransferase [Chloroflexota bacterium]|nr:site-specific DNA-methyltransferase [Chloroflexota bacterium]